MKPPTFSFALLFAVATTLASPIRAQANGGGGQQLSFLSQEDRTRLIKAREQVFASHADLKAEQESLKQERASVKGEGSDVSVGDRKTLRENMLAHNQKMRTALLQADPTLGPVLDQVDAKMKERFQEAATK